MIDAYSIHAYKTIQLTAFNFWALQLFFSPQYFRVPNSACALSFTLVDDVFRIRFLASCLREKL